MDETNTLWIAVAASLAIGGLIGFLIGRSGSGASQQAALAKELEENRAELETYKRKVNDHFEETAALVGNLTDSYKAVHTHLAESSRD
ncbi:MAG: YhcB family protein, partial [Pontibacterium sp.]